MSLICVAQNGTMFSLNSLGFFARVEVTLQIPGGAAGDSLVGRTALL